jgi:hypothetical protein
MCQQQELIPFDTAARINSAHLNIIKDIVDGHPGEPLLQNVLIQQAIEAEMSFLKAMEKLMGKYIHAQETAIAMGPCAELDALLATFPRITTENNG